MLRPFKGGEECGGERADPPAPPGEACRRSAACSALRDEVDLDIAGAARDVVGGLAAAVGGAGAETGAGRVGRSHLLSFVAGAK